MSILIRGMEMSKSCADCKLRQVTGCCGNLPRNTRMPNCPLVEVPPHGRLIDADALGIRDAEKQAYEAYLKEKDKFYVEGSWLEYMQGRLDGLADASGRVRFAPTIIPADEEVYDTYTDTAGNLHWTGTHSGRHIIPAEEDET